VFGSNKLKENLGASWLIQEIYKKPLEEALSNIRVGYDFNAWNTNPGKISMKHGDEFEIGYIGGGNALLFFKHKKHAEEFIKKWTTSLLFLSPGVITATACSEINLDNIFSEELSKIFAELHKNKYGQIPNTVIPRHGITAECSHSGYSMENCWSESEQTYLSGIAMAKIDASEKAMKELEVENEEIKRLLDDKYCFTDELDKLGQLAGESHIAIVHIDGNGMGKRFQNAGTLEALRNLSCSVKKVTSDSFTELVNHVVSKFSEIETALGYGGQNKWPEEKGKKIIPFRPIIIGGDDITFVSEGRLGIYLAKLFLKFFETYGADIKDETGKGLSACAGVAITKTKYPFYRGYELSEELCGIAKKIRLKEKEGSWLDFHISYGGFSGTLSSIRDAHYKSPQGDLLFRPYKIKSTNERGFETLVRNTKELKKSFPKNKVKELRQVLTLGKVSVDRFMKHIDARGLKLPDIKGKNYHVNVFENAITPYFDMVEFMEFYPFFEL